MRPADVASVRVEPERAQVALNATVQLSANVYDADGALLSGLSVSWASVNDEVATVDGEGTVTGLAIGETEIEARAGGRTGSATVEVLRPAVIQLEPSAIEFTESVGAPDPAPVSVAVTNGGDLPLTGLTAEVQYGTGPTGWATASLSGSSAPATVSVDVDPAGLEAGTYEAAVLVEAASAPAGPVALPVTMQLVGIVVPAPSGLVATAVSPSAIDLEWNDNGTSETEFRIERRTGTGSFARIATTPADETAYSDTGLNPDTEYFYRVQACEGAACSGFSAEASAKTPALLAPDAPSSLVAEATDGVAEIDLSWTDNSDDEEEFRIQRRAPGEVQFAGLATVGPRVVAYTDDSVEPDGTYVYRVTACAEDRCSAFTNEDAATTYPLAPSDLDGAGVSNSRIDLSWSDNSAAETGFEIERKTGSGSFSHLATTGVDATTYSDAGLAPETSYTYRVRACNGGGCSGFTTEVTVATTATPAPAAPDELTATFVSLGSGIRLDWRDNSTDETSFRVERSVDGGGFTGRATLGANAVTFTDDQIARDHVYTYRVEACASQTLCSDFSNEASATTPPAAPSGLSASSVSASAVQLTWTDDVATETRFEIQRSAGGGSFGEIATPAAGASAYSDTGVSADTDYAYRIRACNGSGCSDWSATLAVTTPPAAPSDLRTASVSSSTIGLAWDDDSETETRFELHRATNGGSFSEIAQPAADAESHSDGGVSADNEYAYRIRACNSSGCSAWSSTLEVTTPPVAPTNLRTTSVSASSIGLAWNDASDTEQEFELQRSTGATFIEIATPSTNATTYTDGGLSASAEYRYRIRACNDSGCSDWSNTLTVGAQPTAPTGLATTSVTTSAIGLSWVDQSATETRFELQRSVDGGSFTEIAEPAANATSYSDANVSPDTEYAYRIRACNARGCSAWSSTLEVTTPPVAPSGLDATSVTASAIGLAWEDESDTETRFELHRSIDGGGFTKIAEPAAGATSHSDTGVSADTEYAYRIRACNDAGCSAWSSTLEVSTPPVAPSGLSVGSITASAVGLSWTDNSSTEAQFRIERRSGGGSFTQIGTAGANATGYTDSAVQGDSTYTYRVRACNSDGACSPYSGTVSALMPPVAPTVMSASPAGGGASIALSWNDNSAVETGYQIQRDAGSGFADLTTLGADDEDHVDATVAPDGVYTYRVRACNGSGCSGFSNTSAAATRPNAPSGLTAELGGPALRVELSWDDVNATETRHEVERGNAGGTGFANLATLGANAEGYSDTGVVEDTTVTYRVRACNAAGCSPHSGVVSATTPPTAASNVAASVGDPDTIGLSWTDNSSTETQFRIERDVNGGGFVSLTSTVANQTSYQDGGVVSGATYTYRVIACNGSICAAPATSNPVQVP